MLGVHMNRDHRKPFIYGVDKMGTRFLPKHDTQRDKFTDILRFIRFDKKKTTIRKITNRQIYADIRNMEQVYKK